MKLLSSILSPILGVDGGVQLHSHALKLKPWNSDLLIHLFYGAEALLKQCSVGWNAVKFMGFMGCACPNA